MTDTLSYGHWSFLGWRTLAGIVGGHQQTPTVEVVARQLTRQISHTFRTRL